jgi:tRNA(Ile)-lysidine synthase
MPDFENELQQSWPAHLWRDVTVVVAVSGGPDSVALLRGLCRNKDGGVGRLVVAHFNHRLRGPASDADEQFVRELAEQLQLPYYVQRAPVADLMPQAELTPEAQARQARYAFLQRTTRQIGARYLATGHTADDQAETILHRILRGTGIGGLAGIPRTRPLDELTVVIRPLLFARRAELLGYLASCGQPYRSDDSNQTPCYTRNRIRSELLPHLAQHYNPQIGEALLRLGELAAETQACLDAQVDERLGRAVVQETEEAIVLDCQSLSDLAPVLRSALFIAVWRRRQWPQQAMGFSQWRELAALAEPETQPPPLLLPAGVRAVREGPRLKLSLQAPNPSHQG